MLMLSEALVYPIVKYVYGVVVKQVFPTAIPLNCEYYVGTYVVFGTVPSPIYIVPLELRQATTVFVSMASVSVALYVPDA